jgi:SAM-dependent methyltransferase
MTRAILPDTQAAEEFMEIEVQKKLEKTAPFLLYRAKRAARISLSFLFSGLRRASLHFRSVKDIWDAGMGGSILFWDSWLATKGNRWPEDYKKRVDPNSEVSEPVAEFVKSSDCKILDVGAGPLTLIGKKWKGRTLDITAVDALGDEYQKLLKKHGVVPLVPTQQLDAEKLTDRFAADTFDITNAQNCLDHSYDPVLSIEQMLMVTKPGGVVTLVHSHNEGAVELYRGLHQWNFRKEGDRFLIASPGLSTVDMTERLKNRVEMNLYIRPSDDWLVVTMKKR